MLLPSRTSLTLGRSLALPFVYLTVFRSMRQLRGCLYEADLEDASKHVPAAETP
jgi:hypothetical protein